MTEFQDLKLVFTGPMGVGKTTAIAAISEIEPVSTEAENSDHAAFDKDTTTVALDYGQLTLNSGQVLRLYGTPGQARFSYMWEILGKDALGVVILLDASQPDALAQLEFYFDSFLELDPKPNIVIGLGRHQEIAQHRREEFFDCACAHDPPLPIFSVDVRRRRDVLMLIDALLSTIESASLETHA